jgi:hydrogenase large subunit
MGHIVIDPLTRIEGHLKIEAEVENGVVRDARSAGMLVRGFEIILKGRDPRDAQHLTQRICGVCPTSHGCTSVLCLEDAFGISTKIPENGRMLRNLVQGANYIQSHILHFYHLAAIDFVDITAVADYSGNDPALLSAKSFAERALEAGDLHLLAPFYPRYEGDYRLTPEQNRAAVAHFVQAFDMRRIGHEMSAIFSGIMPMQKGIVAGGCTENVTTDRIAKFLWKLQELRNFIDNVYIPDVLMVARAYPDYFEIGAGCGNFLSFGVFDLDTSQKDQLKRSRLLPSGRVHRDNLTVQPVDSQKITEDVTHSWYEGTTQHPFDEETVLAPFKEGAYSWVKAPRYEGEPYEVGPLSTLLVAYASGNSKVKELVDGVLSELGAPVSALFSTLGRHAARALQCKLVADSMVDWVLQLKPGEPTFIESSVPDVAQGAGFWEAPRGALSHFIKIEGGKIKNYQAVVPSTWNASPADGNGQKGPIEQALIGTKVKDEENPFELARIVRSFDPCLACAIHMVTPKGRDLGEFRVS